MSDEADREPGPEEVEAAEALARALEGAPAGGELGELVRLGERLRATAGLAPPLDPAVRDAAIDEALGRARRRGRLRRAAWVAAAAAVLLALALGLGRGRGPAAGALPDEALAAPADALFGGPFPEEQTASERLDAIVAARTRGYFAALSAGRASGGGRGGAGARSSAGALALSRTAAPSAGLLAASLLVLSASGCAEDVPARGRVAVDERLLAALGLAQAYHHQADLLAASGEPGEALRRVRSVLEIPFPEGAPEREDVRLDAHGRLGELLLGAGDEQGALEAVGAGLAEASRPSYFQARLHAVRGRVLEARAARLRQAGDDEAARRAGREAIAAFERSVEMNRALLGLGAPEGGERP